MSRPGFVLDVDERTPPLLVHSGESFRLQEFPLGTRVVYPAESLPAVPDLDETIEAALLHPLDSEPLPALLRSGMKLTIAFDDLSLPLPPMRKPDVRQRIIEHVLQHAADAGVDDVELIVATALHRRMTAEEIKAVVGERVFRSFWPDQLYNFDAEDPDALAHLGMTDKDEDVEISKRAAVSDLLVYVNVNLVAMDGGWKSTAIGLASYKSLKHHHNAHTMVHSRSFMDPKSSQLHSSAWRMGSVINSHVKVFQIETTLNNNAFPSQYGFLTKREWEWSLRDQTTYLATKRGIDLMPAGMRRKSFQKMEAPYGVTGVTAGAVEPVHDKTLERVHSQQLVEVNGQSDVMVLGLPYLCPYNVNSVMNPILAACLGLGYMFNMYVGKPLVRKGGVLILHHPVPWEFSTLHHPSYVDFFDEVLATSTDPKVIGGKFEEQYATDPWYRHLYRTSNAYHGVHPFYMWYWCAHALDHLGQVIWVGGDRRAVARMGMRSASTFADALELARDTVGASPSITYLHSPPHILANVT
jgi:lactate racemase